MGGETTSRNGDAGRRRTKRGRQGGGEGNSGGNRGERECIVGRGVQIWARRERESTDSGALNNDVEEAQDWEELGGEGRVIVAAPVVGERCCLDALRLESAASHRIRLCTCAVEGRVFWGVCRVHAVCRVYGL